MKLEYIETYPNLEEYKLNIDRMLSIAKDILPSMKLYKYRSGFIILIVQTMICKI